MKRIIGIDPGETTGYCQVLIQGDKIVPVRWEEIPLDNLVDTLNSLLMPLTDYEVAIESVVITGKLNNDKVRQIQAYDRSFLIGSKKHKVSIITPGMRKSAKVDVPKAVKGNHARDAYRLAVTKHLLEEQYAGKITTETNS